MLSALQRKISELRQVPSLLRVPSAALVAAKADLCTRLHFSATRSVDVDALIILTSGPAGFWPMAAAYDEREQKNKRCPL